MEGTGKCKLQFTPPSTDLSRIHHLTFKPIQLGQKYLKNIRHINKPRVYPVTQEDTLKNVTQNCAIVRSKEALRHIKVNISILL
jgi:hypothetical protein